MTQPTMTRQMAQMCFRVSFALYLVFVLLSSVPFIVNVGSRIEIAWIFNIVNVVVGTFGWSLMFLVYKRMVIAPQQEAHSSPITPDS